MPSLFIYHYQRDNLENANIQSWFNIFAISEYAVMMLFFGFTPFLQPSKSCQLMVPLA